MGRYAGMHDVDSSAEDSFLELGLRAANGGVDLVTAHKWFNLAAMRGSREAARLRLEIAAEMSPAEIAAAQRAAREWTVGRRTPEDAGRKASL